MCCFSRPVERVADTNIFARSARKNRQYLVYSMRISTKDDLAMILPLPTPPNSPEDAVRFINLEKYPEFFTDLAKGFPAPVALGAGRAQKSPPKPQAPLAVVEVGSFIASFVPTVRDFSRLDERFRLPAQVWDALPQYKNAGFAVFQLKKGEKAIHPMAFEFPRMDPRKLFFPTVHIHDGKLHATADFDHWLYCQPSEGQALADWNESAQPAELFMNKIDKAGGVIAPTEHVYRRRLSGMLRNADTYI